MRNRLSGGNIRGTQPRVVCEWVVIGEAYERMRACVSVCVCVCVSVIIPLLSYLQRLCNGRFSKY